MLSGWIQARQDHRDEDRNPHENRTEQRQQTPISLLPWTRPTPGTVSGLSSERRRGEDSLRTLGRSHLNTRPATFRSRTSRSSPCRRKPAPQTPSAGDPPAPPEFAERPASP